MAAIELCSGGATPDLIDRDGTVGDALCGGFLSWRTAAKLRAIDACPVHLGAPPVATLALIAGTSEATARLPSSGFGLSRHALDSALRKRAVSAGARLVIDRVRAVRPDVVEGEASDYVSEAIFLASGKHDVRGQSRPRDDDDPALGLRIRIPAHDRLATLLDGRIELHLFAGGYAGIVLQEDGSANVCLALRKSLLADAGGKPRDLLDRLAAEHPHFAQRIAFAPSDSVVDTVGSVPYGWIARTSKPGLYRLGDQAAVIPSLAGEGMAIALDSGISAARAWLAGRDGPHFQARFAARARWPVRVARLIWQIAERQAGASALVHATDKAPWLARAAMTLTRL
ncbi:NAD(P)/FAD-dependent oxidoreductase [Tsuneonella sp. SYSU-LHT278]|uniref:NAD(P)/FAD-dependent oxidoreductase n=1 Tax=Tsuneonella sediminis TaxID=3416089 RepID=UPI003F7A48E9